MGRSRCWLSIAPIRCVDKVSNQIRKTKRSRQKRAVVRHLDGARTQRSTDGAGRPITKFKENRPLDHNTRVGWFIRSQLNIGLPGRQSSGRPGRAVLFFGINRRIRVGILRHCMEIGPPGLRSICPGTAGMRPPRRGSRPCVGARRPRYANAGPAGSRRSATAQDSQTFQGAWPEAQRLSRSRRSRRVSMHCQNSPWRYAMSCPSAAIRSMGSRSQLVSSPSM